MSRFPMIIFTLPAIVAQTQELVETPSAKLDAAIKSGQIAWKFSEPEEIVELLGKPEKEEIIHDGNEFLTYQYNSDFKVIFSKTQSSSEDRTYFGLFNYTKDDRSYASILLKEPTKVRNISDFYKLDLFWGISGMDASSLDLTKEEKLLREMPFDTLTKWPPVEKLPEGINPTEILESGKNPGLGLRAMHAKGIDGRGIDLAVIDQPLIPDHLEIKGSFNLIAEMDVQGSRPQMHGPAVTSLAVGKTCGVAPGANLHYVSMAMWNEKEGNRYYIQALENILELNKSKRTNIKAVSISTGMFRELSQYDIWQALLEKAESEGVLVITCDKDATKLQYALLRPLVGGDRDKPEGYTGGSFASGGNELLVPGDCRTYASHLGKDVYSYGPHGGMSWVAPWIAGLAALGFQVNPDIKPAEIRKYLMESATDMPFGKVVNPERFLEMCVAVNQ